MLSVFVGFWQDVAFRFVLYAGSHNKFVFG